MARGRAPRARRPRAVVPVIEQRFGSKPPLTLGVEEEIMILDGQTLDQTAGFERILPWLPVVLAMSANSPWLEGELTGFASNRAPVLTDLPRAGGPPEFASYADWEAWVERLVGLGVFEDETRIWWDVRPAPKFGTLAGRVADQPTDVRRSAAFAALLQALGDKLSLDGTGRGKP